MSHKHKNYIIPYCIFIVSLFLLITVPPSISQSQDTINNSLDSAKVYFFYNDFESQGPDFLSTIDTLVTNVQRYDPPTRPGRYYATLGNPGLAQVSMVYNPFIKSGFDFGIHSFDQYKFNNDSIKYYWVGRPFTHIYFVQGSKKEQTIHVDHSQNVSSWFNLGVKFRYVNSPGYYINQESDDKNFVFKTRFQTRNYRYIVLANYIHNKLKLEENGGITYDSVFTENVSPARDGIVVNLNTANNLYKENSFYLKQFFKLSKQHRFNMEDTVAEKSFFKNINPGNVAHSIHLNRYNYLYRQELSDLNGFYRFTHDSLSPTYDSTNIFQVENQLMWTNSDNAHQQLLTFNLKVRHLYTENSIDSAKNIYNQLIPSGEVQFHISDILKLYFLGDFVTGNYNVGDFNIQTGLDFKWKIGTLSYQLQNASQDPAQLYQSYSSNHFIWENEIKKQYFLINKFKYNYKTLTAGLNLLAIQNFVYMDSLGTPSQLEKNMQLIQFQLRKLFKLGNWSLDTRIIYQKASINTGLRVPDLVGDFSLYYTKDLFKNAAIIQTGVNVFYNTPYKAYAYMPATRSFFVQNDKELGDYFYTDAFFNLQVKRARIFLKYYNLGFLLSDFRYYTVPSYPMRDGGIRFGVSWMFYD